MRRHRTDFVALFFGLAFLAAGAGFIVHQTTDRAFDVTWIVAVALVSIGCIFLGATLLRSRSSRSPAATASTPSEPSATPEPGEPPDAALATANEPPSGDGD